MTRERDPLLDLDLLAVGLTDEARRAYEQFVADFLDSEEGAEFLEREEDDE